MKLFRPLSLESFNGGSDPLYPDDRGYLVARIVPSNGQEVNTGDLLFVVRPMEARPA
jgi:hypothetical protein